MAEGWITIADKVLDGKLGYQGVNQILQQIRALASPRPMFMGGSRSRGVRGVTGALTINAVDWLDLELDGTKLAGFTVRVRVEVRTDAVGTSVTPRVQNITDATTAVTGSACTSVAQDYQGTNQIQTLSFTPAAGLKKYRLQLTAGDNAADVYGIAYVEVYGS